VKYQRHDFTCGPGSIVNALRVLGTKKSEKKVAELAGTTPDGTDEEGLMAALDEFGYEYEEFCTDTREEARAWLQTAADRPLIISVDQWGHWVCVGGVCADRVILFDSGWDKWNMAENGCHALLPETVARRWRAGKKVAGKECRFYGIAVLPKK